MKWRLTTTLIVFSAFFVSCDKSQKAEPGNYVKHEGMTRYFGDVPEKSFTRIYQRAAMEQYKDPAAYEFEGFIFHVSTCLQVQDSTGKVVYDETKVNDRCKITDSSVWRPSFFSTGDPRDPVIVLVENAGCSETWGNTVYVQQDSSFVRAGDLELGNRYWDGIELNENIAPYTHISVTDGILTFSFTCDEVTIWLPVDHSRRQNKRGDQVRYVYEGEVLNLELDD